MPIADLMRSFFKPQQGLATPDILIHTPVQELATAIEALEARTKVILSLVYFEGLEKRMVASALRIDELEVEVICDYAVAQLRLAVGLVNQKRSG